MIKIAIIYDNDKEYIDKLIEYDPVVLFDDIKKIEELQEYNLIKRNIKYDDNCYDILISETENVRGIQAIKKVVIGKQGNNPRITYLQDFDIEKILEPKKRTDYKFSIIVPNYNNAKWIDKTIESVLNQTYQNWEMFIIDDMSTDNSIEIIKRYKDSRITLIENKIKWYNGGSRNWGILKAKETNPNGYLLFIDSDDWLAYDKVLEDLNNFIEGEDLITLDYEYYMNNKIIPAGKCFYHDKNELFMTIGCICAVWCKCFKVSVAPLFEFNTLMEDRNYHYRLINRIDTFAHFPKVTHTWNKMNTKSITTDKDQIYESDIQGKIEWDNCAFRHIAGMLDLLNEIQNPLWKQFIEKRIIMCKRYIQNGTFLQY